MAQHYRNPLEERYASPEMLYLFSPQYKFSTWRKLWLYLAEVQQELGYPISDEQLAEMRAQVDTIDFEAAAAYEKKFRHDVMAHIYAFGAVCPKAKPIIHLGVTSAFVGDNTDIIQMKEALLLLQKKMAALLGVLSAFSERYKALPTLGFTHYQPAQLTTVGKRATLWMQSLLLDFELLQFILEKMRLRGVKGTTGTAASFKALLGDDYKKIQLLDKKLAEKAGFSQVFAVSGQTYDRKVDAQVLGWLSGVAQSAHKFTNDLRLLQNLKEIEEPFEKDQIGSSAMAYKRNPMRSERIAALSKFVMALSVSSAQVAATQWLERTLDDSANKRLTIPQAFLAVDAILILWLNIAQNLVVYPKMIEKHIIQELPFMATEEILMDCVKRGGDRQQIHEIIRQHSLAAAREVKEYGRDNDLIDRLAADKRLSLGKAALCRILSPERFTGFAQEQTESFLQTEIQPLLAAYEGSDLSLDTDLKV